MNSIIKIDSSGSLEHAIIYAKTYGGIDGANELG